MQIPVLNDLWRMPTDTGLPYRPEGVPFRLQFPPRGRPSGHIGVYTRQVSSQGLAVNNGRPNFDHPRVLHGAFSLNFSHIIIAEPEAHDIGLGGR